MIRSLRHENEQVRYLAAYVLGELGELASRAVYHLIRSLQDENEQVRYLAAYALLQINPEKAAKAFLEMDLDLNDLIGKVEVSFLTRNILKYFISAPPVLCRLDPLPTIFEWKCRPQNLSQQRSQPVLLAPQNHNRTNPTQEQE